MNSPTNSTRAAVLMFALLAAAGTTHGYNIEVFVDPNTWVIQRTQGDSPSTVVDFQDQPASFQDQYGYWHYRYFTGGFFDHVVIEDNNTGALIESLGACNNIFYIDRSVKWGYVCGTGYNGTGNGATGEVRFGTALSNGDFLIGGNFTSAGGYPSTSYFSCYQWNNGWSGVNGVYASARVMGFTWNGNYQLQVTLNGGGQYVYGPLSSGGASGSLYLNTSTALWNNYYKSFAQGWWSQ